MNTSSHPHTASLGSNNNSLGYWAVTLSANALGRSALGDTHSQDSNGECEFVGLVLPWHIHSRTRLSTQVHTFPRLWTCSPEEEANWYDYRVGEGVWLTRPLCPRTTGADKRAAGVLANSNGHQWRTYPFLCGYCSHRQQELVAFNTPGSLLFEPSSPSAASCATALATSRTISLQRREISKPAPIPGSNATGNGIQTCVAFTMQPYPTSPSKQGWLWVVASSMSMLD